MTFPSPLTGSPGKLRAFTLPELLVTVAILAIVLLLALPVFQKARSITLANRCQNNLRQISTALFAYTSDNNGRFPLSRKEHRPDKNGNMIAGPFPWNTDALQPYIQTPAGLPTHLNRKGAKHSVAGPFWCPAAESFPVAKAPFTYAYNIYIGHPSNTARGAGTLGNVQRPDKVLFAIDNAPNESSTCLLYELRWPFPAGSKRDPGEINQIDFKRHGGNHALGIFMDGHVEKLTFDQLGGTQGELIFPR